MTFRVNFSSCPCFYSFISVYFSLYNLMLFCVCAHTALHALRLILKFEPQTCKLRPEILDFLDAIIISGQLNDFIMNNSDES